MTTADTSISCVVHRGKSVLNIESIVHDGRRVMLDRNDLVALQRKERLILEAVARNVGVNKPEVIDQFDRLVLNIDGRFNGIESSLSSQSPPDNSGAMMLFIKNLLDDRVRPATISECCGIDFTTPIEHRTGHLDEHYTF